MNTKFVNTALLFWSFMGLYGSSSDPAHSDVVFQPVVKNVSDIYAHMASYNLTIAYHALGFVSPQNASPYISVSLRNVSTHSMLEYLDPASDYNWDVWYKPSNSPNGSWLHVAPKVTSIAPRVLQKPFTFKFANIRVDLSPGQHQNFLVPLNTYALTLNGDYRISLSVKLPDPTMGDAELGPADDMLTKCVTLTTIHSQAIVLRHTPNGWKQLSADGTK